MSDEAVVASEHSTVTPTSCVIGLAEFFPAASPVRLPVVLTQQATGLSEETTLEYGTAREVLLGCGLPLADGSLDAEALVVALQFHGGRTAVAARFAREVSNWIVKQ